MCKYNARFGLSFTSTYLPTVEVKKHVEIPDLKVGFALSLSLSLLSLSFSLSLSSPPSRKARMPYGSEQLLTDGCGLISRSVMVKAIRFVHFPKRE